MTYKELIEKERAEYIGSDVEYEGRKYTVVDVDYNGGLLIDKPAEFTPTTAVSRFDKKLKIAKYEYGMRLRGFAPMCQPMKGLLDRTDDDTGRYYDKLLYDRKLTEQELKDYELDFIREI